MTETRKGDWIQLSSGGQFWPFDPRPEEINIHDIAHALSNLCRFGGHCTRFYSVAEHSILVSRQCPRELRLAGLLHDASEAYLVDIPRPIKRSLVGYIDMEAAIQGVINSKFGLDFIMPREVHEADDAVLCAEAFQIMHNPLNWFGGEAPMPAPVIIRGYAPLVARGAFLAEYSKITGKCS